MVSDKDTEELLKNLVEKNISGPPDKYSAEFTLWRKRVINQIGSHLVYQK